MVHHHLAKMSLKFTSTLLVLVYFSTFCSLKTSADKAIPLITVEEKHDDSEDRFVLNPDAIAMIKKLSSPVKVISAIGDARVGKSTALNYIHYTLSKVDFSAVFAQNEKEIFEAGNAMNAVTRDIWLSTISGKQGMAKVLLLDVEGTDLGDGAVTDRVSIFTALMSSTLMLFMKESPNTHITDFLYEIVRLSEKAFGKEDSEHFPHLTAVLRGALKPPKGYDNINEYIIDALITPKWNDELDKSRKEIGKRFPKEHIKVFNLPYVLDFDVCDQRDGYFKVIQNLTSNLTNLPEKKSLGGALVDGQTLADLAERLVKVMNNETLWKNLSSNFYQLFEGDLCTKSYEDHIKPLLDGNCETTTAQEIKDQKGEKMKLFKEHCILKERVDIAKRDIDNLIKNLKKCGGKECGCDTFTKSGYIAVGVALAKMLPWLFSDVKLKENITLLNNSEYETIGLHGVGWVWNKEAERLGLSGRGSGVVAQEVALFYPWAVTEGHDGYKRVNYLALRLLIMTKKFGQRLDDKNQTYQDPKLFQHIDYSTKIYKANQ